MTPRVGVGGHWHETNTFVPLPTRWNDFERYKAAVGDEVLALGEGTRTELGGAFAELRAAGAKPVELGFAAAVPSGLVARAAFEGFVAALERALPLDGLVVCLHGAMVAEGHADAEAVLVEAAPRRGRRRARRRHAGPPREPEQPALRAVRRPDRLPHVPARRHGGTLSQLRFTEAREPMYPLQEETAWPST